MCNIFIVYLFKVKIYGGIMFYYHESNITKSANSSYIKLNMKRGMFQEKITQPKQK